MTAAGQDGDAARATTEGEVIRIEGRGPLLVGLNAELGPGESLTFGRSRRCRLSLRKAPAFAAAKDPAALLRSAEFNRVSRVHLEIVNLGGGRVEIRDRSRNGTWVRGTRVDIGSPAVVDVPAGGRTVDVSPIEGAFGCLSLRR